jgi:hypothetical protein
MRNVIARSLERAAEWYAAAQHRAQRRRSLWNLILLPLGFAAVGVTWYALFRAVWAFHMWWYPEHQLRDFWGSGISFRSFVPSFLMVFAVAPGALCTGLALANCAAWLIRPARRALDREAAGHVGTGFRQATGILFRLAAWTLGVGFIIALVAAYSLSSLR